MILIRPQKYGRPNENTPAKWNAEYKDFTAPGVDGDVKPPQPMEGVTPSNPSESDAKPPKSTPAVEDEADDETKKRKRHEGETPEERAERKRKKKEKKEKKKSKEKSKGPTKEDEEEEESE